MGVEREQERVSRLLGARDLIQECEEMLRGEREAFTGMDEYLRQRLLYWQERYNVLDRRRVSSLRGAGEERRKSA